MTVRIYQIKDRDGTRVCERGTKKACLDLLEKYAGKSPHWDNAPYFVFRVETTHVKTFRPRTTQARAKP